MTTADVVRNKALALAGVEAPPGAPTDEAVEELLDACGARRVPVVLARQQFLQELEAHPRDPLVTRALELIDQVLGRLPAA